MKTLLIVGGVAVAAVVGYMLLNRKDQRGPIPDFNKNQVPDPRTQQMGGENKELRFADDLVKTLGSFAEAAGSIFGNKKGDGAG